MELEFCRQVSEKSPDIKFHENPSSENRVVPYRQTNMTKLIVAFRNFANAPKNTQRQFGMGLGGILHKLKLVVQRQGPLLSEIEFRVIQPIVSRI
jgi:hypothetical protein